MAFKITVVEITPSQTCTEISADNGVRPVYEQRVENLDLRKLIDAVNFKPRVRRITAKDTKEGAK